MPVFRHSSISRIGSAPRAFSTSCTALLVIYAWALLEIARCVSGKRVASTWYLLFFVLLILIHAEWAYRSSCHRISRRSGFAWIREGAFLATNGVAAQDILGPCIQPSLFGVPLVAAIALFLREHHYWAVASAVAAASVNPMYVLHAALLTAGFMLVLLREGRLRRAVSVGAWQWDLCHRY